MRRSVHPPNPVPPRLKGLRRWLWLLVLMLGLPGCAALPKVVPPRTAAAADAPKPHRIDVVSHGWHTGIVIAAEDAERALPFLKERFQGATHYELGWGDKGFYMADEVTTGITLRAMFWAQGSVVHVVALQGPAAASFPASRSVPVELTAEGMASLMGYVDSGFLRGTDGRVLPLRNGLYGDSQFYDGVGRYHVFNTCNKWTAKALRSGGVVISPALKLTSGSVLRAVSP